MLSIFKGDTSVADGVDHYASAVADLVSEASEGAVTRPEALRWLLTNRHGRALLIGLGGRGTSKQQKEFEMPTRVEVLKGLLRQHGGDVVTLCKHICKTGSTDVAEAELCGMIQAAAQSDRRSGETVEQAFARKFNDLSPDGIALRKATRIASGFEQRDDSDAFDDADSWSVRAKEPRDDDDDTERESNDEDAYDELCEEAVKLRKHHPTLSEAQLFALAYKENPRLAAKEARQNRPFARRSR
jgi:hypothetical protein